MFDVNCCLLIVVGESLERVWRVVFSDEKPFIYCKILSALLLELCLTFAFAHLFYFHTKASCSTSSIHYEALSGVTLGSLVPVSVDNTITSVTWVTDASILK